MLKELRKQVAKEKRLPPFVIFRENSLEEMATAYPTTMEELEKIQRCQQGQGHALRAEVHRPDSQVCGGE